MPPLRQSSSCLISPADAQVPGKKKPRIVEHQPSGRATLPSVVNFPAEDVVLIGEEAQQ